MTSKKLTTCISSSYRLRYLQTIGVCASEPTPGSTVPKAWILLDNQSTVDVFYNKDLLVNVRKSDMHMDIHCNVGVTSTDQIGDLTGYGTMWYHPNCITNTSSH
jgi:hypothetical protein